jgi:hypothetical protein
MRSRIAGRSFLALGLVEGLTVAAAPGAHADVPGAAGIVQNLVGEATGWAWDKVASGIAAWILGAVAYFVNGAVEFLRTGARPDVESAWFSGPNSPFATVRNIAGVLLLAFVFLGLIQGLVQGDGAGMARRVAGNLPLAVAGMVVTTAVVGRLLELTDALSSAVLSGTGEQSLHFLSGFGTAATLATQGFAAVLLGLVAVVAALLLWVELMVRASLVYLLVAISPLGFAAMLWPSAKGFIRKTMEILLAVIVSKFVICVALAIGVAALSGAGEAGGQGRGVAASAGASLGTLLVGAVLLGLAAFSPFLVLKLIPVAEGALLAQGASRGPARAAQTGLSTYSSTRMVSRLSGSGSGSNGGNGGMSVPASASGGGAPAAGAGAAQGAGSAGSASGASGAAAAAGPAGAVVAGTAVAAGAARNVATKARQAGESAGEATGQRRSSADAPPHTDDRPEGGRGR